MTEASALWKPGVTIALGIALHTWLYRTNEEAYEKHVADLD